MVKSCMVTVLRRERAWKYGRLRKKACGKPWNWSGKYFLEFEGPDYSQEGIDEFKRYIDCQAEEMTLAMYGGLDLDALIE